MTLYSCHTPTGRPVLTDGWKPSGSAYVGTDGCIGGALGTLGVRFGANAGAVRGWALTVPEGTSLTSFEARVCGFNGGNSTAVVSVSQRIGDTDTGLAATTATRPQIGCVAAAPWYGNAGNAIKGGGDTVRAVTARASCLESCDGNVGVDISSFRAEISDEAPPGGAVTGGSLDTSTIQTGPETLTFSAKDVGVGVYRAVVEAQINRVGAWQEVLSAPVKPGTLCTPVRETAKLYEFASPQPCPNLLNASLTLQKGALPVGLHDLRVRLEDAAGNSSVLVGTRSYEVPKPPDASAPVPETAPETGGRGRRSGTARNCPAAPTVDGPHDHHGTESPAAHGRKVLHDRRDTRRSRRHPHLWRDGFHPDTLVLSEAGRRGRLVERSWNGHHRREGQVPSPDPRWLLRTVLVSYAAPGVSDAVAQADFTAPASITVRAKRTHLRNGTSAVFRGQVAGPIPNAGVPVFLEVREPTRWIPVATTQRRIRTSPSGNFTLSYKFLRTFQPARYRFRIIADEDSAFPYRRGTSPSITIYVRP